MGIVLLAFLLRIQGVEYLPAGQFTETDGYFYYWQAHLISEYGQLPDRDMHRWLPLGRDLGQTLNLYGYVLAYTHKAIAWVFPSISLYHVVLYMPVVCLCIGLGAICLFLYRTDGLLFSSIVGLLLATLPGSIERSSAGFGDRDAWCLMLGIFAVTTYLASLQTQPRHKRLSWTLASGFSVFLGGISWEGFGVFLSVILIVEICRFLTSETEEGLTFYLLWVCAFVPSLYFISPAYRSGYGFAAHLYAFVIMPPVMLLILRTCRHLLVTKIPFVPKLRVQPRTLSLGLMLVSIAIAVGYVFTEFDTFANTTVPLSQNQLMQTVTELGTPHFNYWTFRYGGVFILGSIGLLLINKRHWDQTCMLVPLTLFISTTFFREPLEEYLWGTSYGTFFFLIALICTGIAFLISSRLQPVCENSHFTSIAFTAWFLFWVTLSRDAKRYDFFIGVPLAFFTADTICFFSNVLSQKVKHNKHRIRLKTCIASGLLTGLLFFPPLGAHTQRSSFAATQMRKAIPVTPVAQALQWMKTELSHTTVVAAHWRYGSQLNVLSGVKTIIDQDHYIQHWILLYHQHVHKAKEEQVALEFLKTHGATHIMLTQMDPKNTFLRGQLSGAFIPIYPEVNFPDAEVKVWEIHYPSDIKTSPKYLETGFPEIDRDLQP